MASDEEYRIDIYAQNIIEGRSQTQAYLKAFADSADKWAKATVWNNASQYAKKPEVIDRVAKKAAEMRERNAITIDNLLEQARRVAYFDPICLFDEEGNLKPLSDIDEISRTAMGVKVTANGDVMYEFKSDSKLKAVDMLGKAAAFWYKGTGTTPPLFQPTTGSGPQQEPPKTIEDLDVRDLARRVALMLTKDEYTGEPV